MPVIETVSGIMTKARTTNSTDTNFPSKVDTLTRPSGGGVVEVNRGGGGGVVPNVCRARPYALGANNDTFNMRVIGWDKLQVSQGVFQYTPQVLVEFACTCGNITGVAGGYVLNTEFWADTISLTYGNANVSVDIVSPANDLPAHAVFDIKAFQMIEFIFDLGTTPTSMNCLYCLY